MKFRISHGFYKGKVLTFPKMSSVRPTKSVVREALFEILGDDFKHLSFLDLYSGSGMLGIDALSRGFSYCVFVEEQMRCVALLKKHLDEIGVSAQSFVFHGKVEHYCRRNSHRRFDVIYLSPPYRFINKAWLERILLLLPVAQTSRIFVEHRSTEKSLLESVPHLRMYRYGSTYLTLFTIEHLFELREGMS